MGLFCNQTAFDFSLGEYTFQTLAGYGSLKRLFVPEHGLFAELQDQVPLSDTKVYADLGLDADIVSLYAGPSESPGVQREHLADLDAMVIDVQDVGCRCFTYTTSLGYLLERLAEYDISIPVYIIDHPNPAGRQVEGIPLPGQYASFLGRTGLPHRHGLTVAELSRLIKHETAGRFELKIIPYHQDPPASDAALPPRTTWGIPPSPNMPGPLTPMVYSGQCLLEGTNVSEGRGTTRPFEIFGAPFLSWIVHQELPALFRGASLRPMRFVPTFHKYAGEICHGFQIHLTGEPYHSLAHTLQIIRFIREGSGAEFRWREGSYEQGSDRTAIELLAGDEVLLAYLNGEAEWAEAQQALTEGEEAWIKRASEFLIYSPPLHRVS
ncbi:DUF1343 domain-containing protein [Candidatus Neomarinimicrobiota bacterium]